MIYRKGKLYAASHDGDDGASAEIFDVNVLRDKAINVLLTKINFMDQKLEEFMNNQCVVTRNNIIKQSGEIAADNDIHKLLKKIDSLKNEMNHNFEIKGSIVNEANERFSNECCVYSKGARMKNSEMVKYFRDFVKKNYRVNRNTQSLIPEYILRLDKRIEHKRTHFCKSCDQKALLGCCKKYSQKNRVGRTYFYNVAYVKPESDDEASENDQDT